jgi:LmbE family N-acetylglucosaminyl deacetylase
VLTVSPTALGTSEAEWLAGPVLHSLPTFAWAPGRPVVVVAPHPDDEVLGTGGFLRTAALLGSSVVLVAVTDGEASHPRSFWTGARMGARRRAESTVGLANLGLRVDRVMRCGIPDGRVGEHEEVLTDILAGVLDDATLCLSTWRADGHPDHDAVGRAAAVAAHGAGADLVEYPVWAWHWASPEHGMPFDRAVRLDLDEVTQRAKVAAIGAHVSQIRPLGPRPVDRVVLPPSVVERFVRPFETFFVQEPP